jgi:uncharacterized membrane protein (GlpM family)
MTTVSPLNVEPRRLQDSSVKEWAIRFGFGGLVTALVGVISTAFGPTVGGLFLAFPAIAIASLTLITKHTEQRPAAGADALGAAVGSVGLIGFGATVWVLAPRVPGVWVLILALVVWLALSLLLWVIGDAWRRRARS